MSLERFYDNGFFDWNATEHSDFPIVATLPKPSIKSLLRVKVDDEGPRDGLQGTLVYPSADDIYKYLGLVDSIDIDVVTAGIYSGRESRPDKITKEVLEKMREEYPNITPIILARAKSCDIDWALECREIHDGLEVIVFQGLSPQRLWAQEWDENSVLLNIGRSVTGIKDRDNGCGVIAFTEDTSRMPPELLEELVRVSIDSGADRLGIADTTGHLDPWGADRIVGAAREMLDLYGGRNVGIDFHTHNDRGNALWNSMAAVGAGADRVHGVLLSIGERAGNAPLGLIMYNVQRLLKEAGVEENKWNLRGLYGAALHYAEMTGTPIPLHAPLIGSNAFTTSVGVHANAQEQAMIRVREIAEGKTEPTEDEIIRLLEYLEATVYTTVDPSEIGRHNDWQIGPLSGSANVRMWLRSRGHAPVDEEIISAVLDSAKQRDRILRDDEVFDLLRELGVLS